jgi:arylformamidase
LSTIVYTPEFVERGYNNRAAVPDHPRWLAHFPEASATARAALAPKLDLRYGPGPRETLDLFLPPGRAKGTFLFLHGGYWRMLDKSDFSFVALPFVARGYAVADANYDLCPDVSIAAIVDEARHALMWLATEAAAHGANPDRIVVGGHSAGGHLAAMLFTTDWVALGLAREPFVGGVSLSGVHDLAPMVQFSFNADFRLDAAEAARLSPAFMTPRSRVPLVLAVGAEETSEFIRQTRILWDAWPANRPPGARAPLIIPGRHHFSVVVDYANPDSELTRATLALLADREDESR